MIPIMNRPYGEDGQQWLLTGNGSATNPYKNTPYSRVFNSGMYGNVQCGSSCLYNNYTFNQPGILSPMVHGQPTGTANVEIGGDGAYLKYGTFRSEIEMKDVFARFDLDLATAPTGTCRDSWAQAENLSDWTMWVVSPSAIVRTPCSPTILSSRRPPSCSWGRTSSAATPAAAGRRCLPAVPATFATDRQHAATAAHHAILFRSVVYLAAGRRQKRMRPGPLYRADRRPESVERGNRRPGVSSAISTGMCSTATA
jgi:hypothetical protein